MQRRNSTYSLFEKNKTVVFWLLLVLAGLLNMLLCLAEPVYDPLRPAHVYTQGAFKGCSEK